MRTVTLAVDLDRSAVEPVRRADLANWIARGWIECTRSDRRGRFGTWETYELTAAGELALGLASASPAR